MFDVPADIPVNVPDAPIVATVVLEDNHTPPPMLADNVVLAEGHTVKAPVITGGAGAGFTVMTFDTLADPHALITIYITVSTPAAIPVIIPLPPILALLLATPQIPPIVLFVIEIVLPVHTSDGPLIVPATGTELTVYILLVLQPVGSEYVIDEVPAAMLFITPVDVFIETIDGALLLHVPPVGAQAQVVDVPVQPPLAPVIAEGNPFTVTIAVT